MIKITMKTSLMQAKKLPKTKNKELFFSDSLRELVFELPERSQEIIFNRFGIFDSRMMTLEQIGKKHNITRERVRQVIREVLKKIKENKEHPTFTQIQEKIILALQSNGGIMKKEHLIFFLGEDDKNEQAAVGFFLQCVDGITEREIAGELKFSYSLDGFNVEKWKSVKDFAIEILKNKKKPLLLDELFQHFISVHDDSDFSKEVFAHYLKVSEEMKQNTFGKWGIAMWKEISPKGTREKAYLVLKETGKPLHFRDIAKKIDQHNLSNKKTHSQTVHNELIKDSNFVLVGRGIYALAEWGYKKGTVKDVISEILKSSSGTLPKEEIIEKVLKIRKVKKSTIVINLNNYFSKSKNGMYTIKK